MEVSSKLKVELNWSELIEISKTSDLSQCQSKRGVYIWGFTIGENFIAYYVGRADNILKRIHEHITDILGGNYTIYHSNSIVNFKKYKQEKIDLSRIDTSKCEGKVYERNSLSDFKYFLDNRTKLQPHIDVMVDNFTFSFAILDNEIEIKEVEKQIISKIGKDNLANLRCGNFSEEHTIEHIGNSKIVELFNLTNISI
jgi:hypothetical protein